MAYPVIEVNVNFIKPEILVYQPKKYSVGVTNLRPGIMFQISAVSTA